MKSIYEPATSNVTLPPPARILGIPVHKVTFDTVLQIIENFINQSEVHQIVTLNSLMLNTALIDLELQEIVKNASLVLADSAGIFWAAHFLNDPLPELIPGIDLVLKLCQLAATKKYRIYLLGARKETVEKTVENIKKIFSGISITGFRDGYFLADEEKEIISQIRKLSPHILFVALGSPRQEKWIAKNLKELNVPVVIGVGGSFDIISGKLSRAPRWMNYFSLEWSYRLLQEPWRIKRIIQLPIFVFRVIKYKCYDANRFMRIHTD